LISALRATLANDAEIVMYDHMRLRIGNLEASIPFDKAVLGPSATSSARTTRSLQAFAYLRNAPQYDQAR
jgi:hypothetical protein